MIGQKVPFLRGGKYQNGSQVLVSAIHYGYQYNPNGFCRVVES